MPTSATTSMHPLETLAPFRRWRPSPLRNFVYTFVWNGLIGVALAGAAILFGSRAALATLLAEMLLASNVIGFLIHGAVHVLRRIAPGRDSRASPRATGARSVTQLRPAKVDQAPSNCPSMPARSSADAT